MKSRRALQRENKSQKKMLKNLLMYAKQMGESKLQNFMTQEVNFFFSFFKFKLNF